MDKKNRDTEIFLSGSEEYVLRIRSKYELLCDSERQVADFFLDRKRFAPADINIKTIAEKTGTSVATVVRFCKSLGFKGFSEFKYSLQKGVLAPIGGTIRIGSRDTMEAVKQKVAEFARRKITASIQNTDSGELERAVEALEKCSRVVLAATGTVSGVAMAIANNFMVMGIPCHTVPDPLTLYRTVSFCGKSDVVIGITSCGYIKEVVDALMIARDRGATTICVTGVRDSLVTRYADIVLYCTLKDHTVGLDSITVSMCHLLTLQTLQVGYLTRRNGGVAQKIDELYSLSEMTRYAADVEDVERGRVRF